MSGKTFLSFRIHMIAGFTFYANGIQREYLIEINGDDST